jgi:hypothetical protein
MAAKHQYVEIEVPKELDKEEKLALSEDLIEYIRKRTAKKQEDVSGKKFKSYSPEYVKSLDFKIAGKSKGKVNLTQTGDMLAAIETLDIKSNKIKIGFERGTLENAKADGNANVNGRPFLGFEGSKETKAMKDIIKKHVIKDLDGEAERKALLWLGEKTIKKGKA